MTNPTPEEIEEYQSSQQLAEIEKCQQFDNRLVGDYDTHNVYFDIETLPSADEGLAEKLADEVKAPVNYKDETKIAEYKAAKAAEMVKKTSFDGGRGRVACIAWAVNDSAVRCEAVPLHGVKTEIILLQEFFAHLPKSNANLVGHNIVGFDIPFLTKRAIALGVNLPKENVWPRQPKPWGKGFSDTMLMWDAKNFIGQDALCDVLGIEGKGDIDGSKVAGLWASGEYQKVIDYCVQDVERTRKIHQRFLAAGY